MGIIRAIIHVNGQVQGVGFRPAVYRWATELGLAGGVRNDRHGVFIEAEGEQSSVRNLIRILRENKHPPIIVHHLDWKIVPVTGEASFSIHRSEGESGPVSAGVTPDLALCDQCRAEISDPSDRRFHYPFINCTSCGPRFSIITGVPYDRPNTTMSQFQMCPDCKSEYENPPDRRYHAQPVACPACGPRLIWHDFRDNNKNIYPASERGEFGPREGEGQTGLSGAKGRPLDPSRGVAPDESDYRFILRAADLISAGGILALKGLGGYHLICDARNESAVKRLRFNKKRDEKPFAVMFSDPESATTYADVTPAARSLMESSSAPIVLLPLKKSDNVAMLARSIAPGLGEIGVMIPYTPLHRLLIDEIKIPLVMTSGNISDQPILYEDEEALSVFSGIADAVLYHNRPIHIRVDDSVARCVDEKPYLIRRSRGYAPSMIDPGRSFSHKILASGGDLKNVLALAFERQIVLSHHMGDLEHPRALVSFESALSHYEKLYDFRPDVVAHDLHPRFFSTRAAKERYGDTVIYIPVQHHHAHIASCMLENGIKEEPVIGIALDGTGLGEEGDIRGGEVILADYAGYKRLAALYPIPLPGGEKSIREIWRQTLSVIQLAGVTDGAEALLSKYDQLDEIKIQAVSSMLKNRDLSPPASSCGRLLDAMSCMIGLRSRVNFEGQAPMELEALLNNGGQSRFSDSFEDYIPWQTIESIENSGFPVTLDWRPMVEGILEGIKRGDDMVRLSYIIHNSIVRGVSDYVLKFAKETGIKTVALSGGCFYNMFFINGFRKILEKGGIRVIIHSQIPAGDGGIAAGQAIIADEIVRGKESCVLQYQ